MPQGHLSNGFSFGSPALRREKLYDNCYDIAVVRLKNELRLQFDHPWRCIRTQTRAIDGRRLTDGLSDLSELVAVDVCVWEGKVRMIEEIKEPRANRESSTLPSWYHEGLFHVEVSVKVTWATKLVTALASKIICRVGEIGGTVARIGQPVHQLCG